MIMCRMTRPGCLWGIRAEVVGGETFPLVTGLPR